MSEDLFIPLLSADELPPGTKKAIDRDGRSILLCNANGRIHAVSNICSHAHERLDCGRMSHGWISCPIHGARFDLATGQAKNPPAKAPIPVYEWRIVDGWIAVKL